MATVSTASGLSYAWISGHTGLEAQLIGEVMEVTAGMPADQANELTLKIMVEVDELLPSVDKMLPFEEAYDVETVQPKPQYEAAMMKVKEGLARLGMPYR